jgi:nitrogen fixation NifU-like protein
LSLDHFREVLLSHARNPRNLGEITGVPWGECFNPICGDKVTVYLELAGPTVTKAKLKLLGCTMCTASASLMSEIIMNRSVSEVLELKELLETNLLAPPESTWPQELAGLVALSHLRVNRARVPCAMISWIACQRALKDQT